MPPKPRAIRGENPRRIGRKATSKVASSVRLAKIGGFPAALLEVLDELEHRQHRADHDKADHDPHHEGREFDQLEGDSREDRPAIHCPRLRCQRRQVSQAPAYFR